MSLLPERDDGLLLLRPHVPDDDLSMPRRVYSAAALGVSLSSGWILPYAFILPIHLIMATDIEQRDFLIRNNHR